jgi:hypothetical protein
MYIGIMNIQNPEDRTVHSHCYEDLIFVLNIGLWWALLDGDWMTETDNTNGLEWP